MTKQRKLILGELQKTRSHPTADEVYERLRPRLPRLSLGTVYRNLEQLSGSGHIQKLEFGNAPMRFDAVNVDHVHIRCTRCGRVDDLKQSPRLKLDPASVNEIGYQLAGYRIELWGLCPECRETGSGARPGGPARRRAKK